MLVKQRFAGKTPIMTRDENALPPVLKNVAGGEGGPHNPRMRVMEYRIGQAERRMDRLDGRLDRIDGRLDRMDGRLDRMDGTLTEIKITLAEMRTLVTNIPTTGKLWGVAWTALGVVASLIIALGAFQHSVFQTAMSAAQTLNSANQPASPAPQIHIVPVSPPQTASPSAKP